MQPKAKLHEIRLKVPDDSILWEYLRDKGSRRPAEVNQLAVTGLVVGRLVVGIDATALAASTAHLHLRASHPAGSNVSPAPSAVGTGIASPEKGPLDNLSNVAFSEILSTGMEQSP